MRPTRIRSSSCCRRRMPPGRTARSSTSCPGSIPQGCQIYAFKKPSSEELDHNFLWRYMKALPERGRIGIFNRSYYEDVLVVRVHPELLGRLPDARSRREVLAGPLRRHQRVRAAPDAQRHAGAEVPPERVEEGAAGAVPGAARSPREALEVLGQRSRGAEVLVGVPDRVRADDPEHEHEAGAVVGHPRGQQVGDARRSWPASSPARSNGSDLTFPKVSDKDKKRLEAAQGRAAGKQVTLPLVATGRRHASGRKGSHRWLSGWSNHEEDDPGVSPSAQRAGAAPSRSAVAADRGAANAAPAETAAGRGSTGTQHAARSRRGPDSSG